MVSRAQGLSASSPVSELPGEAVSLSMPLKPSARATPLQAPVHDGEIALLDGGDDPAGWRELPRG